MHSFAVLVVVLSLLTARVYGVGINPPDNKEDEKGAVDYYARVLWPDVCEHGHQQSPINIDSTAALTASDDIGRVEFGTLGTLKAYTVWFTGSRLQLKFDKWYKETDVRVPASQYMVGNSTKVKLGDMLAIELKEMHYHTMSEHTVDGCYYPGELHIVTEVKNGESDYCDLTGGCFFVFGIMTAFEGEGESANKEVKRLFSKMPEGVGTTVGMTYKEKLNMDNFLPTKRKYFTYLGSLTTPPCSEVVTWLVFTNPIAISKKIVEDHQMLVSFTPGDDCTYSFFGVCTPPREKTNHRIIQSHHGRDVFVVKT